MSWQAWLSQAQGLRDAGRWTLAIPLYQRALASPLPAEQLASTHHNLGLCYFGSGQFALAYQHCVKALQRDPRLWQAASIIAKCQKELGHMEASDRTYRAILRAYPNQPEALLARAYLAMNEFGDPCAARAMTAVLQDHADYAKDAQLTQLMSRLYDRDATDSALLLSRDVMAFSQAHLQLDRQDPRAVDKLTSRTRARRRPRVGLLSPHFHASPVYYLTIFGWRHVTQGCDIVLFNRGHVRDWATEIFYGLAKEVQEVQHQNPWSLARAIHEADIDVLYDLGGWMDPVGLQALSLKPARQQWKWVGGQSMTTGLTCFDGWIGDEAQSPASLQHLYTEPLVQVPGGYATYTPPSYLPKPAKRKRGACVFSNPAKVSRAFLQTIQARPGKISFIHRQYRYPAIQERIRAALGNRVEFAIPASHEEALNALNQHAVMIDTFPYSSGLTAREAQAMGTRLEVLKVGELFSERHAASYQARTPPAWMKEST
jgi:predicted O-linked N-acetylglucosamine transferase (SPINDLY family)